MTLSPLRASKSTRLAFTYVVLIQVPLRIDKVRKYQLAFTYVVLIPQVVEPTSPCWRSVSLYLCGIDTFSLNSYANFGGRVNHYLCGIDTDVDFTEYSIFRVSLSLCGTDFNHK